MDVQTAWIDLPAENGAMSLFVAEPAASGTYPGIAYFHVVLGINAQHQSVASRLASEGYVVAVSDMYHRVGYRLSYRFPDDMVDARATRDTLSYYGIAADSRTALNYLRGHPKVDADQLGAVGYCVGATMALLSASFNRDIKAVAAMYPTDLFPPALTQAKPVPPTELMASINGPVLMLSGSADKNPSPADVRAAAALMERMNKSFEHHLYEGDPPAGHAFFDEDLPMGNHGAVEWAWPLKLDFFRRNLKVTAPAAT